MHDEIVSIFWYKFKTIVGFLFLCVGPADAVFPAPVPPRTLVGTKTACKKAGVHRLATSS